MVKASNNVRKIIKANQTFGNCLNGIYLDHAATTYMDDRVVRAMLPYFNVNFGNPSSLHEPGLVAKRAVKFARQDIARELSAHEDEIIFTSGGTEANNLALQGIIRANKYHGRHVITSAIEHPSVLEVLLELKKKKEIELTILPVDKFGLVSVKDLEKALRPETILVSVMYANNEIGTIQPIAEIGRLLLSWRKKQKNDFPFFHTDACQAAGSLEMNVQKLHSDLLTFNGSKIYGPKGVGALFIRRGLKLDPLFYGGGQEKSIRSGTENVPGIVGLAAALSIAQNNRQSENIRLIKLRDKLIAGLLSISKTRLNGHAEKRLPNNANISFMNVEGEAVVLYLDAAGIYVSTGSACASKSLEPSHVILAIGLPYEAAHGSIRFTLGRRTTAKDIEQVLKAVPKIIEKLRKISPIDVDMKFFS